MTARGPNRLFDWTQEQWAVALWDTGASLSMTDYIECFQHRGIWYFRWLGQNPPDGWIARTLAPPEYRQLARALFEDMAARTPGP